MFSPSLLILCLFLSPVHFFNPFLFITLKIFKLSLSSILPYCQCVSIVYHECSAVWQLILNLCPQCCPATEWILNCTPVIETECPHTDKVIHSQMKNQAEAIRFKVVQVGSLCCMEQSKYKLMPCQ